MVVMLVDGIHGRVRNGNWSDWEVREREYILNDTLAG